MHHQRHPGVAKASAVPTPGLSNCLEIRRLVPDEPDMSRLLQWLDVQDRFDRFGHDPGDAGRESYSRASLATSPAVFGAFIGGRLAGIAEITRCAPDNAAILAFAVEADWRRKGIGCRLLLAALRWADDWGATRVQLQCTRKLESLPTCFCASIFWRACEWAN
jgi:GNAT superfamily N-acetyltransferase